MMVDKDDTDLGVYQCQGVHTIDYTPNSNLWNLYSLGANNNAKENGYSVYKQTGTGTTTTSLDDNDVLCVRLV